MSTNLYRSFGPCTHIHRYEFFLTVNDEDIFFIAYCPDHFTLEHLFQEVCRWAGIDRLNHILEFQTIELQALHRSLRDIGCSNDSCEEDRVLLVLPSTQADTPSCPPEPDSTTSTTSSTFPKARLHNKIEPYKETECTSTSRLSRGFVRTKVTRRTTTVYGPGNIRISETVVYRRRRQPRDWDTWSPPPPADGTPTHGLVQIQRVQPVVTSRIPSKRKRGTHQCRQRKSSPDFYLQQRAAVQYIRQGLKSHSWFRPTPTLGPTYLVSRHFNNA
jgi:hypothetical protein